MGSLGRAIRNMWARHYEYTHLYELQFIAWYCEGRWHRARFLKVLLDFSTLCQNCEKRVLESSCLSVCPFVRPSVRMQQLGFHWTDFYKIWYLKISLKSAEKNHVSIQSDKNNGNFMIPALFSLKWEMFQINVVEDTNTHTFCVQYLFFSDNRAIYETTWKNTV